MPDFSHRAGASELMDDLASSGDDLYQALRELDSINYLLGGNYVTLNGISGLLDEIPESAALHIGDVGCGSGDMLRQTRRLLERRNRSAVLTGIDANPNVIAYAVIHTPAACNIRYEVLNIFSQAFKSKRFDIVTGTLFFHHLQDEALIMFLKELKSQVSVGVVINDIHRHWFAYYAIRWLTKLFSRSAMVRHDAAVSVLRAFRKRELREILRSAGIAHYTIRWRWAFRWQVVIRF